MRKKKMNICLMKNKHSESFPISSSIFLQKVAILAQSPHSSDRTNTSGDHLRCHGKVKVSKVSIPLSMSNGCTIPLPLSLPQSQRASLSFSCEFVPLRPWPLLPTLKSCSVRNLLSCLNRPVLQTHSSGLLPSSFTASISLTFTNKHS